MRDAWDWAQVCVLEHGERVELTFVKSERPGVWYVVAQARVRRPDGTHRVTHTYQAEWPSARYLTLAGAILTVLSGLARLVEQGTQPELPF